MTSETQWLIGIAITLGIFAFGAVSTALYRSWQTMQEEFKVIHSRINKTREEYVRRDELDKDLRRIDKKLDDIANDQKQMSAAVLDALSNRRNLRPNQRA